MARDYSKGKIYKIEPIIDHEEQEIYIGSTTKQYLSQRMVEHRRSFKFCQNNENGNKVSSFQLFEKFGIDNCQIVLLQEIQAKSKDELLAREAYYIKTLDCVNKYIPGRTRDEYNKEYRQDNEKGWILC